MPVLKINGKKVKVDDAFLSMTPEQQDAMVDEIARDMGGGQQAAPDVFAGFDKVAAMQQPGQPGELRQAYQQGQIADSARTEPVERSALDNALGYVGTAADSIAQGLTLGTSDEIAAGLSTGFGTLGDYDQALAAERQRMKTNAENYPMTNIAGNVVGAIAGPGKLSQLGKVAGKGLATRIAAGAGEGALMGAAFGAGTAEEGGRLEGAATGGAFGAVAGGAIPAIGAGLRAGAGAIRDTAGAMMRPKQEAAKRVVETLKRDRSLGQVLSADDIAAAQKRGDPLTVADMGGSRTRGMARAAGNLSGEARDKMALVSERFGSQGDRSIDMVKSLVNGNVDDLAVQEGLEMAAKQANKGAYEAAYAFNFGKSGPPVELDAILQRIPANAVSNAMKVAKAEGRPFGEQLVASLDEAANTVTFARMPSMRELDYIQRGLRAATTQAYKSGAGEVGKAYQGVRRELIGLMDQVNPAFQKARQGAAAAFGAEDALDAGRKAVMMTRKNSEIARDFMALKPHEKELFRIGYASELIDRVKSVGDRVNVVNTIFGRSQEREKIAAIFGPAKMKELESFIRVENVMQMVNRDINANSTTARQLAEMGLGGVEGNIRSVGVGDIVMAALRKGSALVNEKMAGEIAELLMSDDPAMIQKLVKQAATNKTTFEGIKAIESALSRLAIPAGAAAISSQASQ